MWSKLGPGPPFPPMRVLQKNWSGALSLVCESGPKMANEVSFWKLRKLCVQDPTQNIQALATPPATSMNMWPWLAKQPCRLPHKRHFEGRHDDGSKNLGNWNNRGIPIGNPWNPVVATLWSTETVLSRLISVPSHRQWWGTSCRSCGGSTVAEVKWLHGPRSFPSLH